MTTESWEWAVDVLAEELAATPTPIRQQVLDNLMRRAGYESVDAEFDDEARVLNVRAELVRRLAARMAKLDEQQRAVVIPITTRDTRPRLLLQAGCDGR